MSMAENDGVEEIESPEVEEQEAEQPEESQEPTEEGEQEESEASDEVVVTIDGESPPQDEEEQEAKSAPVWVRELRKRNQETVKENRELKRELEALKAKPAEKEEELGPRPEIADFGYDTEEHNKALDVWYAKKQAHDAQERRKQEEGAKAEQAWQEKLNAYGKQARELKVPDYADAEATAKDVLSAAQEGIIVSGAENAALVVYAIGKNTKKAAELAAIKDPVKFAFAVAKLETQMKVTPKKQAPLPESSVRGNARVGGTVGDSTLERLRKEADQTGDRTKVAKYMREMNAKKRA